MLASWRGTRFEVVNVLREVCSILYSLVTCVTDHRSGVRQGPEGHNRQRPRALPQGKGQRPPHSSLIRPLTACPGPHDHWRDIQEHPAGRVRRGAPRAREVGPVISVSPHILNLLRHQDGRGGRVWQVKNPPAPGAGEGRREGAEARIRARVAPAACCRRSRQGDAGGYGIRLCFPLSMSLPTTLGWRC